MDSAQFNQLAAQYPRVRDRSYRLEWSERNQHPDSAAASQASSPTPVPAQAPPSSSSGSAKASAPPSASSFSFFDSLHSFLLSQGLSASQSQLAVDHVRRDHFTTMFQLNLDEMEVIARSLGEMKKQRQQQQQQQQQHAIDAR